MPSICHDNCKQNDARQILKRSNHECATLTEAFYRQDGEIRKHSHSAPHLGLVLSGECSHQVGTGKAERCIPRELHYLPAGETHAFEFGSDTRCLLLKVSQPIWTRLAEYTKTKATRGGRQGGPALTAIAQRLLAEFDQDDDLSALAVECLVTEALLEIHRGSERSSSISPAIWRARDLLNDGIGQPIRLGTVAAQIGMHPAHLAREFRRTFHCTMSECLRGLRVQKAKLLLPKTRTPLNEIAVQCGFYDQSHFCRCFKQIVGVSPLVYRRQANL